MASGKKGKSTAAGVSRSVLGKILKKSFLVIALLICGGIIFNLDRITGYDIRPWLPGFITRWLPASGSADKENVAETDNIPDALPGANTVVGKVVSVYDGDTLTLVAGHGNEARKYKVRFFGIDAPEAKQPYGIEARDSLRDKVLNKEVTLEIVNTDRYGRSVGKIYLGARYINREMVAEGSAWYYPDYAEHEKDLEVSQDLAKKNRAGLWKTDNPQPPWLYRKEMRKR